MAARGTCTKGALFFLSEVASKHQCRQGAASHRCWRAQFKRRAIFVRSMYIVEAHRSCCNAAARREHPAIGTSRSNSKGGQRNRCAICAHPMRAQTHWPWGWMELASWRVSPSIAAQGRRWKGAPVIEFGANSGGVHEPSASASCSSPQCDNEQRRTNQGQLLSQGSHTRRRPTQLCSAPRFSDHWGSRNSKTSQCNLCAICVHSVGAQTHWSWEGMQGIPIDYAAARLPPVCAPTAQVAWKGRGHKDRGH